ASLVKRASKGRSSPAAQSKLNAAEAHHGLLHHTRRLLLAALPGALRDATPRRLVALLRSLQELQPELRLEPSVGVQVVQLLVQGLVGTHRRFLSDCSTKELVELAALLQASPDWRQHLLPAVAAHVVAAKQAQQPGTGQQAVRELEGVVMQQAVKLGSLAIPTAAQLSPLLLISDKRSLEVAVKQLVTQLTAQREAAAAAATVLLLDWQEHAEEAVRQSELDTLLQLPRLAAVVGQPLGGVLQPVFESQLVQLSHGSSGGTIKAQQLLFENTDRFQQ
ncbi:hypothetical protein HaLaN_09893, partial [Haematococcus lacustris]